MPGVGPVTSIVNLPGLESPAAAAALLAGRCDGPPARGPRRRVERRPARPRPGHARRPAARRPRRASRALPPPLRARRSSRSSPEERPDLVGGAGARRRISETAAAGGTDRPTSAGPSAGRLRLRPRPLRAASPGSSLFVVGVTYVVLLVLLRSVVLPLKAVIMNILSLLAGYGALVCDLPGGPPRVALPLHRAAGSIDAELPVILFCTVFGVSMDYEVFLLTRMREAWDRDARQPSSAVAFGLAQARGASSPARRSSSSWSAGSFAFTSILITKAIGVGLAVAVALDATRHPHPAWCRRSMRLLGRWNWWLPGWLDRRLPRIE